MRSVSRTLWSVIKMPMPRVRETLRIVDRAYIMNVGEILIEGDRETIAGNALAKKFYLGDTFTL